MVKLNPKKKTLKQVQDEAKKQGHCHCNMVTKCPCQAFKATNKCRCFEAVKTL